MPSPYVLVLCAALFIAGAVVPIGAVLAFRSDDLQGLTELLVALATLVRVLLDIARHMTDAEPDDQP